MVSPDVIVEEVLKRIRERGITAWELRGVGIPAKTAYRMVGKEEGAVRADTAIKAAHLVGLQIEMKDIEDDQQA